jgi:hypothetical protein
MKTGIDKENSTFDTLILKKNVLAQQVIQSFYEHKFNP